jgi:hypothetical protein
VGRSQLRSDEVRERKEGYKERVIYLESLVLGLRVVCLEVERAEDALSGEKKRERRGCEGRKEGRGRPVVGPSMLDRAAAAVRRLN